MTASREGTRPSTYPLGHRLNPGAPAPSPEPVQKPASQPKRVKAEVVEEKPSTGTDEVVDLTGQEKTDEQSKQ